MKFIFNQPELKTRRRDLRNAMPKPEQVLWYYLKGKNIRGYKFRRQYSVGNYILDFYCPKIKLAIEIDGDSHFTPRAATHDQLRAKFLRQYSIQVLRFTNTDITKNIEPVVNKILEYLP